MDNPHGVTSRATSKPTGLTYGVPQGSVLGPILFPIYYESHTQSVVDSLCAEHFTHADMGFDVKRIKTTYIHAKAHVFIVIDVTMVTGPFSDIHYVEGHSKVRTVFK